MPSTIEYETLIQEIETNDVIVAVKFTRTVKLSTITNDKFQVRNLDTSTDVTDPFDDIILSQDYNSIGRILTLHWVPGSLSSNTNYRLTITGLKDASGIVIDDDTFDFTTGTDANPDPDNDGNLGSDTNVVVEDFSIKAQPSSSDFTIIPGSGTFYITESDPSSGEYYLDTDYNNGRITIKFSSSPQAQFINSTFIRGQRKKIQRSPAKWETLDVHVSKNSSRPEVYVDFPSLDTVPVYDTIGSEYFEENYKYRILVSKDVSS